MSSDIAISVKNLSKTYRIFGHPGDRIKQALTFGRMRFHKEFIALQDVSFEIRKGETVGIIGRNGSGKSTLLQLICGILKPTSGIVKVNGRVSALLELGAGFNPEFTGRENVYFQGALMGLTKAEMDSRFDEIAAFADIGEFINQPVRMYSSGMYIRLAFSVAVSIDPDILAVDEALAVGDLAFQAKCLRRMESMQDSGKSILMVSHSVEQLARLCDKAILLDHGRLVVAGMTNEVSREYLSRVFESKNDPNIFSLVHEGNKVSSDAAEETFEKRPGYNRAEHRFGSSAAKIIDFRMTSKGHFLENFILSHHVMRIDLKVKFYKDVPAPIFGVTVKTKDGVTLYGVNTKESNSSSKVREQLAGTTVWVSFEMTPHLSMGSYFLSVAVAEDSVEGIVHMDRRDDAIMIEVSDSPTYAGTVDMEASFKYPECSAITE